MSSTSRLRTLGTRTAGPGHPVYITGEIGINHNGDLDNALALIDVAAEAGCDAVKFQKRTPEICTPRDQWDIERDTPWGRMTYIDYRHRVEFGEAEYQAISDHCAKRGIDWFASPWDTEAVAFLEKFDVPAHKVASASLTDDELLRALRSTGRTVILSTGMSTPRQIRHAVEVLGSDNILLCHATSTYPAKADRLNLRVINTLQGEFPNVPIGYSGHGRACRRPSPPSRSAPRSSSATSRSTAPCGAPTRPPPSSRRVSPASSATSAPSRPPSVTASRRCTSRSSAR